MHSKMTYETSAAAFLTTLLHTYEKYATVTDETLSFAGVRTSSECRNTVHDWLNFSADGS